MVVSDFLSEEDRIALSSCILCPVECRANRLKGRKGLCGSDGRMSIASICVHKGEEPILSGGAGICNVFFSGCNLRCLFCQNHEISRGVRDSGGQSRAGISSGEVTYGDNFSYDEALNVIEGILRRGVQSVGFVSPSHVIPQMTALIKGLRERGMSPVIIYNTNGYDKVSTIRSLEGLVDIYLPDFKYISPGVASQFSGVPAYPGIAQEAIREMYRQKGSTLITDDLGRAVSGLIIRHLVLPGHAEESKKVLHRISEELSPGVHISLMSQYHPTKEVADHPLLGRTLLKEEYEEVVEEMERLGFRNGWIQEMDSSGFYLPDFSRDDPFDGE